MFEDVTKNKIRGEYRYADPRKKHGWACWFDRDPKDGNGGSFAALRNVSCNFAATAANEKGVPGASVSRYGTDIDNNSILREGELLQNRNYTATHQAGPDTHQCLHNSTIAANENRSLPKPTGTENIGPKYPPIDCCTCSKPAANNRFCSKKGTRHPGK